MSLSLIAIPVLLDTTTEPSQLFRQWVSMYYGGHQLLPTMSVATFLLYIYATLNKRAAGRQWKIFAIAGIMTVIMLPFTWLVMVPTNNTLFQMEAENGRRLGGGGIASWEEAKGLVTKWSGLHLVRSLFPLAGAVLGLTATFQ